MSSVRLPHGMKHVFLGFVIGAAYGVALTKLWPSKNGMSSKTKPVQASLVGRYLVSAIVVG